MTAQTLDQKRAQHALECVESLKGEPASSVSKYVSHVNALPAAILMNGLGQALAAERASSDKAHRRLADDVAHWLLSGEAHTPCGQQAARETDKADAARRLLHRIVEGDQDAYVRAQAEALAYLAWLKRFANAFLDKPGSRNETSGDGDVIE